MPEEVYSNFKSNRPSMLIQSKWMDESESQYVNWSTDDRVYSPTGQCGRLNAEDGSWSVGDCKAGRYALCQVVTHHFYEIQ